MTSNGETKKYFSRQFFWRYKVSHGEKRSAVLRKWEEYGPSLTEDDQVSLEIDFDSGELIFYANGKSLGTAFEDQQLMKEGFLYPYVYLAKDSYNGKVEVDLDN